MSELNVDLSKLSFKKRKPSSSIFFLGSSLWRSSSLDFKVQAVRKQIEEGGNYFIGINSMTFSKCDMLFSSYKDTR